MTFEEYVSNIWNKNHSLALFLHKGNDEEIDLDTLCLQKIDWINYCIKNSCIEKIDQSVVKNTFKDLINYYELDTADTTYGQKAVDASGSLLLTFFEICKDSLSIQKDERENMDDIFLKKMISVFGRICDKKTIQFEVMLEKILSWFSFRQVFYPKADIGFSALEYEIASLFYSTFQDELLALRNIEYPLSSKFAEYATWIYRNMQSIPRFYIVGDLLKINRFAIQCCRNALVAAQCNGYFEHIDSIKNRIRSIQSDLVSTPTVFISYNWGKHKLVDELQNNLGSFTIVKRDVNEIEFGDNITEFMNTIRDEDYALIVISDAYLKSDACMYELTSLFKDKGVDSFKKKVLFLICEDARSIYSTTGRGAYTEFWNNRYNELVEMQKYLAPETSVEITQSIRTAAYIRLQIGEFLEYVKSVNNFGEKDAIQAISSYILKSSSSGKIGRNPIEDFHIVAKSQVKNLEDHEVEFSINI